MPEPNAASPPTRRRIRALATLMLATATVALLAALPTVPAGAEAPRVSVPAAEQVEELLGQTPLGSLPTAELTEKLSQLPAFEGVEAAAVEKAIKEVIETLTGKGATLEELLGGSEAAKLLQEKLAEALGVLAPQLEELLGGDPQAKLTEALESTGVRELIGKLLSGSPEPQALVREILSASSPERLQSLLGTLLSGAPIVQSTVEQLAGQLGTSPEALAEQFGKSAEQLPGTAMALLAPLANGERLGVVNGVGGVTLGLIKGAGETAGVTGGTGGPGGAFSPGTTTVTVQRTTAPTPNAGVAGLKVGKLKVISRRFKGHRATIVVQVPSAGVLTVSGKSLRKIRREAAKAERVTLHPSLSRAGASSLRKHHRAMKVPIKVSFKPVSGPSSSATVPLVYR